MDHALFRRLFPTIVLAAASLVGIFYKQRRLLQAVSRDAIPDFATHWLNLDQPALDALIVCTALALLFGGSKK